MVTLTLDQLLAAAQARAVLFPDMCDHEFRSLLRRALTPPRPRTWGRTYHDPTADAALRRCPL